MKTPNPELIDDDNPEWTEEDFKRSVPFSGLPPELQKLLSGEKILKPEAETKAKRQSVA
jgi:hypothetical protein